MEAPHGSTGVPSESGRHDEGIPSVDGVRHRFVDVSGLRVHVAEAGPAEEMGADGPSPLVLLHGFPQHWWSWRMIMPDLARTRRVLAVDLRGAGWTDAPAEGYTEKQLVADVVGVLDALELDRVDLVGLDIGGILGYRVCLFHPARVRRFVSIAAPHPWPKPSFPVLVRSWRMWASFVAAAPGLGARVLGAGRQPIARRMLLADGPDTEVWSDDVVEVYLERLRDPARARAASALYRALAIGGARRSVAGAYVESRLVTPMLSVYGTVLYDGNRDEAGHPGLLHGYEEHADSVQLAHVPEAGYYLAEEQPEAVVRLITGFLDG